MYYSMPSQKEIAREKAIHDSVVRAENRHIAAEKKAVTAAGDAGSKIKTDTLHKSDSIITSQKQEKDYGIFYPALKGKTDTVMVENDLMKAWLCTRGGKLCKVELKNFKTSNGTPLYLFKPDSTAFGVILNVYSKFISTDTLQFSPDRPSLALGTKDTANITMQLITTDPAKTIQFIYTLTKGSYLIDCKIRTKGLQDIIASNTEDITLNWSMLSPSQESNDLNQRRTSTLYYKYYQDDVDYFTAGKDEKKALATDVSWVCFKQQFFSSILIADTRFGSPEISCSNTNLPGYIKYYTSSLSIPYDHKESETFGTKFYFGPNDFKLLKKYSNDNDWQLERLIYLGWRIVGCELINRVIVLNVFHLLNRLNLNFGIVILILTLVIKACLFPIAYRTYVASAKMKLLKPEIDEIGQKFPKTEDAMKKQQAMMALYKKAGVNPMAGCLPQLFQLPILVALINFFPASIELRQQHFLWVKDLSTFDSIYTFHGFSIPFYGDHISLFALLMSLSQYLYIISNKQLLGGGSNDQMAKTMKYMTYITPVLFLGFMNNYSAGLSYYYFLANIITFGQIYFAKLFIDEKELHRKIQENKLKPVKVSKFQKRLEDMMKSQQAARRRQ